MNDVIESALLVRKDHIFCTRCFAIEPIHPGDGTPISTYIIALQEASRRHPNKIHENPFEKSKK